MATKTTSEAGKPVKLVLSESEHAALRIVSAMCGLQMSVYVKSLVNQALTEARKKNPKIFPPTA